MVYTVSREPGGLPTELNVQEACFGTRHRVRGARLKDKQQHQTRHAARKNTQKIWRIENFARIKNAFKKNVPASICLCRGDIRGTSRAQRPVSIALKVAGACLGVRTRVRKRKGTGSGAHDTDQKKKTPHPLPCPKEKKNNVNNRVRFLLGLKKQMFRRGLPGVVEVDVINCEAGDLAHGF